MSRSKLQAIIERREREQQDNCNSLLELMEQMKNNPQEFHDRMHLFENPKSRYTNYPAISGCPTVLRFLEQNFLEQNKGNSPYIKFDIAVGNIDYCRTRVDIKEKTLTYYLDRYRPVSEDALC